MPKFEPVQIYILSASIKISPSVLYVEAEEPSIMTMPCMALAGVKCYCRDLYIRFPIFFVSSNAQAS